MTTIYWTIKHFTGTLFEHHPHKDMFCVIAITKTASGVWANLTLDVENGFGHKAFSTREKAIEFVIQSNKPTYASLFDVNYELEYVGCDSEKWYELYAAYCDFVRSLEAIVEKDQNPWWKKILKVIIKGLTV